MMNIGKLTDAKLWLDSALSEALSGDPEKAQDHIRTVKAILEWFE